MEPENKAATVHPWKAAHDALSAYVTTLTENRDKGVVGAAFARYVEAEAAAWAAESGSLEHP